MAYYLTKRKRRHGVDFRTKIAFEEASDEAVPEPRSVIGFAACGGGRIEV
jgi:hypothetical protein